MANILIIGCGYVGQALAKSYLERGDKVWALQRHPISLEGVDNIVADITTVQTLPDVDKVFYCVAAKNHDELAYEKAYVEGAANAATLLGKLRTTQFIYISSTAVYAQNGGEWVDETSMTLPTYFSGKILLKAESLIESSFLKPTIVRFGGIYGPGRDKLVQAVFDGTSQYTPLPIYTNRIHLDDCVGILQFLADNTFTGIYLGVDNEPALYNEILAWLGKRMQKEVKQGESMSLRMAQSNKRCSNQKITQLGYHFHFPSYREGFEKLLPK